MKTLKKSTLKKVNIALASFLAIVLLVSVGGVARMGGTDNFVEVLKDRIDNYLAQRLGDVTNPVLSGESMLSAAGDTYQTAKVYSKIITNTNTTTASIACDGWLVKGLDFYVAPSTTLSATAATTTITLGIYANSTTTTVETSLATDTYSTSTAVYQTYVQADGAGQTCASGKYIKAVFGSLVTTTNSGVLNVEYIKYQ